MVFSSPIFLFAFLPFALLGCFLRRERAQNAWLLFVSVIFYAWGEPGFVLLMIASALANWFFGRWIDRRPGSAKPALVAAIVMNIGLLAFFKYANFFLSTVGSFWRLAGWPPPPTPDIRLPIGISFFTFHAISYVTDIYRRNQPSARSPAETALYIFLFPQLIAGPILRWTSIAPQLARRERTRAGFAAGIRRFACGLAKKTLIANIVGGPADRIFNLAATGAPLTTSVAWVGVVCYTLQIYFDFSGYSDMAIGLGRMFGFTFMENFNYPYIAQSMREFWRRWHISLSTWFRDYVYLPLGGNRVTKSRTCLNLFIVFYLCGLWHGAAWTFVAWGLYHGAFLSLERTAFGGFLARLSAPLRHLYALLVIMAGWVLFRSASYAVAGEILADMSGLGARPAAAQPLQLFLTPEAVTALLLGAIGAAPIWPALNAVFGRITSRAPKPGGFLWTGLFSLAELGAIAGILIVCASYVAAGTYNPFIYFRF